MSPVAGGDTESDIIVSVVGARPHFIKAFPFIKAMASSPARVLTLHTGQHYDRNMSELFFKELDMPAPDIDLGVGSGTHAEQTAAVIVGVERALLKIRPRAVVVYGDTNSTLGATLAATKLDFPVVHIEAGVRCANREMPEEINRTLIDHAADHLICRSALAVADLWSEGITRGVMNAGDFMYDTVLFAQAVAKEKDIRLDSYDVESGRFILSTVHREFSTASVGALVDLLDALGGLGEPVILPLHPRTKARLLTAGISLERSDDLRILEPLGYLELVFLLGHARMVATDSGGLQEEAYWAGVPCVTLMSETTWPETIEAGWNVLVGLDPAAIREAVASDLGGGERPEVYGAPGAARRVVEPLGWE